MIGTITEWRAYATARGVTEPSAASDADATAALVRGSDYVIYHYVANFIPGYDETVPEVELATYEAASIELATPGFFSTVYTPDQRKVLVGVDSIKWQVAEGGKGDLDREAAMPVSAKIDAMLRRYMQRNMRFGITAIGPPR